VIVIKIIIILVFGALIITVLATIVIMLVAKKMSARKLDEMFTGRWSDIKK